ncbi:MAG: radical SAM protein [Deltaproteobacteria bacterium]|nr:radical SAM protein [Deltaproteobacteria bacterium]
MNTELRLEHNPLPQKRRRLPSAYDLAKVAFFFMGFPKNGFGSIDVTKRCNLRCRHCYYFAGPEEDLPNELSLDQWVARLEELKRAHKPWEFPFFNCTWVGGDPLIRKDVIERCKSYFRYNTIVTNGTIPLPDWPEINWYISIDGDAAMHEAIRDQHGNFRKNGRPGIHAKIKENVAKNKHLGITIAYCITRENVACIESVVKDWYETGARHITFDFFTPVAGIDDPLWLDYHERDQVIEMLIALRRIYGDFFIIPERVLRMMRSDRCRDITDNCLLRERSFAFDASGRQKGKCVMGDGADCDRCGCVVPYYLRSLTDREMILSDLGREALVAGRRLAERGLAQGIGVARGMGAQISI